MSRKALEIESLYLYPVENAKKHKTDKFELIHDEENPIPILRRGIKFTAAIRFKNRGYNVKEDQIRLVFEYGPNPNPVKGTRGIARADVRKKYSEDEKSIWYCNVLQVAEDTLTVEV